MNADGVVDLLDLYIKIFYLNINSHIQIKSLLYIHINTLKGEKNLVFTCTCIYMYIFILSIFFLGSFIFSIVSCVCVTFHDYWKQDCHCTLTNWCVDLDARFHIRKRRLYSGIYLLLSLPSHQCGSFLYGNIEFC